MSQPDSGSPVNSQGPSDGSSSVIFTGPVVPQHPYNAYAFPPHHFMPHYQPMSRYPLYHPALNHTYFPTYFSASFAPI